MNRIFNKNINFKKINYESQIANLFFHQTFGQEFNRKDETNIINNLLDYCYTILTSLVCRSIVSKGLNQHIAFYHGSNISTFPLAFDIVEIIRCIADFYVIQIYENNILDNKKYITNDIKENYLEFISNIKILIDGKLNYLNNSIDHIIDWIIKGDFENHTIDIVNILYDAGEYVEE